MDNEQIKQMHAFMQGVLHEYCKALNEVPNNNELMLKAYELKTAIENYRPDPVRAMDRNIQARKARMNDFFNEKMNTICQ